MEKKRYYQWHISDNYRDIIDPFLDKEWILDVGCGEGVLGRHLRGTMVGVDSDMIALKKAKDNELAIKADIERLPFKSDIFDGIIAKDVLEHLLHPLISVNEFCRVLKKEGIVFASVPDVKSKDAWDDYTHVRPFTRKSLRSLFEDGNFKVIKMWYDIIGSGLYRRITKKYKTPFFCKILGQIGIGRRTIYILAKKE